MIYISGFSKKEVKIYLFSFITIFTFKSIILFLHLKRSNFITPDSLEYLSAASNLQDTYFNSTNLNLSLSLLRLPGYPIFISFFEVNKNLILLQVFIHGVIGIITVLILRKILHLQSSRICFLAFIATQFETSLFVYSFRILADLLFAFLILLLAFLIFKFYATNKRGTIYFLVIVSTVLCLIVRPVSIIFFVVFLVMTIISKKKSFFLNIFLVSLIFVGTYSYFNFLKSGAFVYTTVQNHNLLFYEGAGAKALFNSSNLVSVQKEEVDLREQKIGRVATIKEINDYNFKRSLELIRDNKISFVFMHVLGTFKVLFGPNRAELNQILSDSGRISTWPVAQLFLISFSLLLAVLIGTLGLIGAIRYFHKNDFYRFMTLTIFMSLAISGSALAYGRFRAPISAFLIILSSIIINEYSTKFLSFRVTYFLKVKIKKLKSFFLSKAN